MLIVEEQEHHALCYRAISMVHPYAQIVPSFYRNRTAVFTDDEKASLIKWLEWVQLTLASATQEHFRDYQRVKRRTVIVLADVVEAAVEITLATCLEHLDPARSTVKEITGYRRKHKGDFDPKLAVRSWERRLFPEFPLRSTRFEHMLSCFFPAFTLPDNSSQIDLLIKSRNELTHDVIALSRLIDLDPMQPTFTVEQIDSFFDAAGNFILVLLKAIPGKLPDEIAPLDARYSSNPC